jgi:TBC1 domain family member 13
VPFLILSDSHQESLKNVLLLFAKLNAGIRYVQGMNEILASLFFIFRSDPDDKNAVWSKIVLPNS